MHFQIVRNNITKMQVDAIVNTANPRPAIGAGTDPRTVPGCTGTGGRIHSEKRNEITLSGLPHIETARLV